MVQLVILAHDILLVSLTCALILWGYGLAKMEGVHTDQFPARLWTQLSLCVLVVLFVSLFAFIFFGGKL